MATKARRRTYDNSRRREQADATRAAILAAGCDLVRQSDVRDWQGLTVAAVAERAGYSARTVYRHFGTELVLRDAVMKEMEADAGIDLTSLRLADLPTVAARIYDQIASFPLRPRPELDPTLRATHERQREALLAAVRTQAPDWSDADVRQAAAVLDVFWSVDAYQRLASDWRLDHQAATKAVTWAIEALTAAVGTQP